MLQLVIVTLGICAISLLTGCAVVVVAAIPAPRAPTEVIGGMLGVVTAVHGFTFSTWTVAVRILAAALLSVVDASNHLVTMNLIGVMSMVKTIGIAALNG